LSTSDVNFRFTVGGFGGVEAGAGEVPKSGLLIAGYRLLATLAAAEGRAMSWGQEERRILGPGGGER